MEDEEERRDAIEAYKRREIISDLSEFVISRLEQGVPPTEIALELSSQGLSAAQARQFVDQVILGMQEARIESTRNEGTGHLLAGLALVGIGSAITIGTWSAAGPGETYYVTWGALTWGGFHILRGLFKKVTSALSTGWTMGWAFVSLILIGAAVGGSVVAYNATVGAEPSGPVADLSSKPPPDSSLSWVDDEVSITATGRATFSGRVTNLDNLWSVENAKVEVTVYDALGRQISQFDIPVSPSTIPPGGRGTYRDTRLLPASANTYEAELIWEWGLE